MRSMTSGTVVNPLIVEGQVHGGLAQGIAQALYEEGRARRVRDPALRLVRRILDAVAVDLPSFTTGRTETPATGNRSESRVSARPARSRPLRPW